MAKLIGAYETVDHREVNGWTVTLFRNLSHDGTQPHGSFSATVREGVSEDVLSFYGETRQAVEREVLRIVGVSPLDAAALVEENAALRAEVAALREGTTSPITSKTNKGNKMTMSIEQSDAAILSTFHSMEEGVDFVLNDFWFTEINRIRKEYGYSILQDKKEYILSRKDQKLFVSGKEVFDFKDKTNLAFASTFAFATVASLTLALALALAFAFTFALTFATQHITGSENSSLIRGNQHVLCLGRSPVQDILERYGVRPL